MGAVLSWGRPYFQEENMRKPTHIFNCKTGIKFEATKDLLSYADQEPEKFKLIYGEDSEPEERETYTEDSLKTMSMKELQNLVDAFELTCDKRRKDDMIDAILKHRG